MLSNFSQDLLPSPQQVLLQKNTMREWDLSGLGLALRSSVATSL